MKAIDSYSPKSGECEHCNYETFEGIKIGYSYDADNFHIYVIDYCICFVVESEEWSTLELMQQFEYFHEFKEWCKENAREG